MALILYSYWRSSCSYRVRIALNLKQIPYEYRSVHLVKEGGEQHLAAFREKNPMGQVPCLIDTDHNRVLSQSLTLIDYLELIQPNPSLYPSDPYQALLARQLCELVNAGIQPLQNLGVLQQLEKRFGASQEAKNDWAAHFIRHGLTALETHLRETAGLCALGDQPGVVDAFLVPQVYGAIRFGVDMDAFPTLSRINAHCLTLEPFQKAEPSVQPDAQ